MAMTRAPRVGEDWTRDEERYVWCRNPRRRRGPCCFCGFAILPGLGFCVLGRSGELAHYACAPGLGRAILPAGALWFDRDKIKGGTMQIVAMLDSETGRSTDMGVVKRIHYKDRVYAAMVSLEEMGDETAEVAVHVLECVKDDDGDDGEDAYEYRPIRNQEHFAIASVLVKEALDGEPGVIDVFFEER